MVDGIHIFRIFSNVVLCQEKKNLHLLLTMDFLLSKLPMCKWSSMYWWNLVVFCQISCLVMILWSLNRFFRKGISQPFLLLVFWKLLPWIIFGRKYYWQAVLPIPFSVIMNLLMGGDPLIALSENGHLHPPWLQ